MAKIYLPDTDPNVVIHQRQLLGEALFEVAVAAGIARPDAQPNGAELLLLADDVKELFTGQGATEKA